MAISIYKTTSKATLLRIFLSSGIGRGIRIFLYKEIHPNLNFWGNFPNARNGQNLSIGYIQNVPLAEISSSQERIASKLPWIAPMEIGIRGRNDFRDISGYIPQEQLGDWGKGGVLMPPLHTVSSTSCYIGQYSLAFRRTNNYTRTIIENWQRMKPGKEKRPKNAEV